MSDYKNKNVLIVGLARSGVAVAKFLSQQGAMVTVTDSRPEKELLEQVAELTPYKIVFDLGQHSPKHILAADVIVLSPGVPTDLKALEPARQKGTPVTGELELASQFIKEPIIAITGTNGKSTVTRLAYEFLKAGGVKTWIGGNYGLPLTEYVLSAERAEALVVEVSSFQLETINSFNPSKIAFLNFAEDHLDRYRSPGDYLAAKKRIFKNTSREYTTAYLNADDAPVIEMARDPLVQRAKLQYFSRRSALEEQISRIGGAVLVGHEIRVKDPGNPSKQAVYDISQMKLRGRHNVENVLAAVCLTKDFHVRPEAIQRVINDFPGLEHRLEFVKSKGGALFYNDSKATNIHAVVKALEAFDDPVILIAGGRDKGTDLSPLIDVIAKKVKNLILVGEAKERFNRALGDYSETFIIGTFEEAVLLAYQKSRSGDVILLSPGCSSYDMFSNYEERGKYFKDLVQKL